MIKHAAKKALAEGNLTILTDLSPHHVAQGSTHPDALLRLYDEAASFRLIHLSRLHSKVYIADDQQAIVTSGNLTTGGLRLNYEYGFHLSDPASVKKVHQDISDYSSLGTSLQRDDLASFCHSAALAKEMLAKVPIHDAAQNEYQRHIEDARSALVRVSIGTGPIHPVFERTILYLLRTNGPLSTADLYEFVEWLHPDLCDNENRIIKGRNFGRKWKHALRTAQQDLRRRGQIHREGDKWHLS